MLVNAGKLDKRITLLKPTVDYSTGNTVRTYTEAVKAWANVKQLTLKDIVTSQYELVSETYTVLIRYIKGIGADWAVKLPNGCRYVITGINTYASEGYMILSIALDTTEIQEVAS